METVLTDRLDGGFVLNGRMIERKLVEKRGVAQTAQVDRVFQKSALGGT
jgi:hypothetical protein